jgi:Trehalase
VNHRELWDSAVATLEGNWGGAATLPSASQYPHQWSWDSAFISIGLARCNPARARAELSSLFAGQWEDGRLPHILFSAGEQEDAYFPGPAFWDSRSRPGTPAMATSGLIQPPVHARAVLAVARAGDGQGEAGPFLQQAYSRLVRWHEYLRGHRDAGGAGLAAIAHPWESGLDNSPLWDAPLAAVRQPAEAPRFARRDISHVDPRHRPTDHDYQQYVLLAEQYRDAGYDDTTLPGGQFLVEDPLFNAVLLDAELCLAQIAARLGLEPGPHERHARRLHAALLTRLWDERVGAFTARDLHAGRTVGVVTIASLMPLLDPWLPADVADRLTALATSGAFMGRAAFPVPTTPPDSAAFDRRRYWRGPTWMNTNWLLCQALRQAGHADLAGRIASSSLRLLATAGFREYYDPLDGTGLGAGGFSWSAALALDWLADLASSGA